MLDYNFKYSMKYCPFVSFRDVGGWVECEGKGCNFFNNEFGRCSILMIGNSLWRNIDGRKLEEHEGRDVKK